MNPKIKLVLIPILIGIIVGAGVAHMVYDNDVKFKARCKAQGGTLFEARRGDEICLPAPVEVNVNE